MPSNGTPILPHIYLDAYRHTIMELVLALDGSSESLEAARQLGQLPFSTRPRVTLVTALTTASHAEGIPSERDVRLREQERQSAQLVFEKALQFLEPSCEVTEHVIEPQHPKKLILSVAKNEQADLIVLGARGYSGIHRILLGSTADYVANHAECSVMITRSDSSAGHEKAVGKPKPFRIILAYDGSPESKVAYQQMTDFDWPTEDTDIHIAMILEKPKLVPDDEVYDPDQIAEQEDTLVRLNLARNLGCRVTHTVRESLHVGHAIRSIAEEEQRNLVFFGATGKSAIERFFLGSTSRYFLHHAECTMWIARRKQWGT